ncbi:MAG: PQQ-dependent sugar dehydrogenase [Planctomycetota bacterium]|nr:PQQ-dependent sugar dehydrogenase [Planctomycetota bacterium]
MRRYGNPNRGSASQQWLALLALLLLPLGPIACGGGGGSSGVGVGVTEPTALTYDVVAGQYRVGEAIPPNMASVTGGPATTFSVAPALPAGLTVDPATGTISGTATVEAATADYVVTASNSAGSIDATVSVQVGPELPSAFESLAAGFKAEPVVTGLLKVAKMALAPDGRIFYTEVDTGNLRVVDANGTLLPTPYATLPVTNGGHQGLLGLTLSPTFTQDGFVYVQATFVGPDQNMPIQTMVVRLTDDPVNNVGTNLTTIVSGLPAGAINNGGELAFDLTGALLVSLGDTTVPADAQLDGLTSAAGKLLRYLVSDPQNLGGIPADNPFAGSPEFCRGLRNTFGVAVHPVVGSVIGADNGPTADDELNYLEAGKNYGWGTANAVQNPGRRLVRYADVIVPTALAWHDGTTWGADYADNLFMASYDDQVVRRFEMSGATFTEIDDETEFLEFALQADDNKPLDVEIAADGSMYVATFTGIWRITPQ